MADDGEHSLFSASGADGWSVCWGKPAMEEGRKASTNYADEGTAAHDLAARVLGDRIKGGDDTAAAHLGEKITVKRDGGSRTFTVSAEMAEHVDDYVDRCMLLSDGALARGVEQRVSYHTHLGVQASLAFGTTDFWALMPDGRLIIVDLKYGAGVTVYADGFQGRLYAAGSMWELDYLGDVTRVNIAIIQPRKEWFDEIELDAEVLVAEVAQLRAAVPHVLEAISLAREWREAGASDLEVGAKLGELNYLKSSDKACRFCDAKAVCPVKIGDVTEAFAGRRSTAADFEDLTANTVTVDGREQVAEYGANFLAFAASRLAAIDEWTKAVRAEIDRRVLIKGEKIDGFKVVAGKRGARKWTDETDVLMHIQAKVPKEHHPLLFKQDLKTPTQLEKALKNNPDTWQGLQAFITQDEGKPSVVPETDTRAAIQHKALAHDFEDLTQQPAADGRAAVRTEQHPFR